jgi:hypothetical protein
MPSYIEKRIAALEKEEQRLEEEMDKIPSWVEETRRRMKLIESLETGSPEWNKFWDENRKRILERRYNFNFDEGTEAGMAMKLCKELDRVQSEKCELQYRDMVRRNGARSYSKVAALKFLFVATLLCIIVHDAFSLQWFASAVITIFGAVFYERIAYIAIVSERTFKMVLAFEANRENRERGDVPGWNFALLNTATWLEDKLKTMGTQLS